ncbi:MAG: nitrite/sulfite reductase, partial [Alphaproteobacteria bacterium]
EYGRRDNLWKARIKILVHQLGAEEFTRAVEEEYAHIEKQGDLKRLQPELERIQAYFAPPAFEAFDGDDSAVRKRVAVDSEFARWYKQNTVAHKAPGYCIVNISLKPIGLTPGDCSHEQMDLIADLAERFSFDEVRVTHEQNLVLPHVRVKDLLTVYDALKSAELATPNIGLITDIIACPGLDYCDLANARSISIAQTISQRFADAERAEDIGELKIKISGCINACGHHHVGHIGILGVDKKGTEFYQVTLGGSADTHSSIGEIVGHAFKEEELPEAIDTIVDTYLKLREPGESFLKLVRRTGIAPFKERLYADH